MATLTMSLKDEATAGLEILNQRLDELSVAEAQATKATNTLSAAQNYQVTVTQKQTAGLGQLADTSLKVFGGISQTAIKVWGDVSIATEKFASETTKAIVGAGASVVKTAVVSTAAVKGLQAVWGDHTAAVKEDTKAVDENTEAHVRHAGFNAKTIAALGITGAAISTQTGGWNSLATAAATAGAVAAKAASGTGGYLAGGTAAIKLQEAIWENSGRGMTKMADGTYQMTNNMDRVSEAVGKLGGAVQKDLNRGLSAAQSLAKGLWNDAIDPLARAWGKFQSEIDAGNTREANAFIKNTQAVQGFYEAGMKTASSWVDMLGLTEKPLQEIFEEEQKIAEQEEKAKKLREQNAVGLERVASIEKQLGVIAADRKEAERVASISTTKALDAEIAGIRAKMKALAEAGKLSAVAGDSEESKKAAEDAIKLAEGLANSISYLESRRTAIQKQEETARRAELKATFDLNKQLAEQTYAIHDKLAASQQKVFDAGTKRLEQQAKIVADIANEQAKQLSDTAMAAAKEQHQTAKDNASERLKSQGATESQVKSQLSQMDVKFAQDVHVLKMDQLEQEARKSIQTLNEERQINEKTGGTREERQKREIELRSQIEKVVGDLQRKRIEESGRIAREVNQIVLQDARQVEQARAAAEKERILKTRDAEKAAAESAVKAFDTKGFVGGQDQQQVFRRFQNDRAQAEQQRQADKDADLWDRAQGGSSTAMKRYADNQRRAFVRGRNQAANDFDSGNIGESEWMKSQTEVAQQTLETYGQMNGVDQKMIAVLQNVLQIQANQQATAANASNVLNAMLDAQKGVLSVSKKSAQSMQTQIGSLN